MARRNWKRIQPNSQQHAIRLCLDYAEKVRGYSVARVGDFIGKSEWVIYKWLSAGSMPSVMIRPFEFACGTTYVSQYIATSAHKLLVDIPHGKIPEDVDLLSLQTTFNETINLLAKFYRGDAEATETIGALTTILTDLAGHRENVNKNAAPELPLFQEEE